MAEKVFVSENNIAKFVCPKCHKIRSVDVSRYTNLQSASKIRCKCICGNSYFVSLEKRKHFRKKVNFAGIYIHIVSSIGDEFCEEVGKGTINITDISRSGLQLKLNVEHNFKKGDKLLVEFYLDNKQRTLIKKEVSIMNVNGLALGTRFFNVDVSNPYDKALGFYLFS